MVIIRDGGSSGGGSGSDSDSGSGGIGGIGVIVSGRSRGGGISDISGSNTGSGRGGQVVMHLGLCVHIGHSSMSLHDAARGRRLAAGSRSRARLDRELRGSPRIDVAVVADAVVVVDDEDGAVCDVGSDG